MGGIRTGADDDEKEEEWAGTLLSRIPDVNQECPRWIGEVSELAEGTRLEIA